MQRILTRKVGQIQVQKHGDSGVPSPNSTNSANQPRLAESFIILSNTHPSGEFAVPERRLQQIGVPMNTRYQRQSFLGDNSQTIIERLAGSILYRHSNGKHEWRRLDNHG
ncbi:MAG: hypothetical protein JWM16_2343 [Verrucomicrobiales bacterium]|nr:hypothetical protein [Verrucomicrobiales bacterium]